MSAPMHGKPGDCPITQDSIRARLRLRIRALDECGTEFDFSRWLSPPYVEPEGLPMSGDHDFAWAESMFSHLDDDHYAALSSTCRGDR